MLASSRPFFGTADLDHGSLSRQANAAELKPPGATQFAANKSRARSPILHSFLQAMPKDFDLLSLRIRMVSRQLSLEDCSE